MQKQQSRALKQRKLEENQNFQLYIKLAAVRKRNLKDFRFLFLFSHLAQLSFFVLRSPCTTLLRQDRRRLGKAKANPAAFLLLCARLALSLHPIAQPAFPKMRSWISLCAIKRPILRFICITKESPEPLSPSAEGHTKQLRHDATYLLASLLRHRLRYQFSAHRWLHAPAPQDL